MLRRHRADYCAPPPDGLRTSYVLWLTALVEEFGADEVASWDQVRVETLGESMRRIRVNGERFIACLEHEQWCVYRYPVLQRSRTIEMLARRNEPRYSAAAGADRSQLVYHLREGKCIGACDTLEDASDLALLHAPRRPPHDWIYAAWRQRGWSPGQEETKRTSVR